MAPHAYSPIAEDTEEAAAPARSYRRTTVAAGLVLLGIGAVAATSTDGAPMSAMKLFRGPDRNGPWAKHPGSGAKPFDEGYKRCGEGQTIAGCVPTPGPTAPSPAPSMTPTPRPTPQPIVTATTYYTYEELDTIATDLIEKEDDLLALMRQVQNSTASSLSADNTSSAIKDYLINELIPSLESEIIQNVTNVEYSILENQCTVGNGVGTYLNEPTASPVVSPSPTTPIVSCSGSGCPALAITETMTTQTETTLATTLATYTSSEMESDCSYLTLAMELAEDIGSEGEDTEMQASALETLIAGVSSMAALFEQLRVAQEEITIESQLITSELEESADVAASGNMNVMGIETQSVGTEQEEVNTILALEQNCVENPSTCNGTVPSVTLASASATMKSEKLASKKISKTALGKMYAELAAGKKH